MAKDAKNDGLNMKAVIEGLEAKRANFNSHIDSAIASLKALSGIDTGMPNIAKKPDGEPHDVVIHSDTFFDHSVVDAAIKYLGMVRKKQTTKEVLDAIRKGGVKTTDGSAQTLLNSRSRQKKDLVRVGRGELGLKEWYDN